MEKPQYRPDIDGLRAIAVLAVVIYHFGKTWLPGGFVGVDIFFVISGFLITGIVQRSIASGTFSFGEFYVRRIRRILPATIFVTLSALVVGSMYMLPEDAEALSLSAIASILSYANIYYWLFLDTGYFAASSDTVPLLHMWSLGVEEQFYLIWPALVLVMYKLGGRRAVLLGSLLIAITSFLVAEYFISADPLFAYYMLPARAGELLVGGMVFIATSAYKGRIPRVIVESTSAAGVAALLWSVFYISESDGFPGLASVLPTIGAALVIASGCYAKSMVGRLLSQKPFVTIGLLSFSLYLWHWPVLAFYRYAYGDPGLYGGLVCAAVILVLTLFSYHFVEVPFRYARHASRYRSALPIITASSFVVVASLYMNFNQGRLSFLDEAHAQKASSLEEMTKAAFSFPYVCQTSKFSEALIQDERCIIGPQGSEPEILIWGDSNASHYVGYFKALAETYGVPMRNANHSSCVPFFSDVSTYVKTNIESCMMFNEAMKAEVVNYDTVVVGASWTSYFKRDRTGFENELVNTLDYLSESSKNVVVALKVPVFGNYDRQCARKALTIPFMSCESRSMKIDNGDYLVNEYIKEVARNYSNVSTLSVREHLCKDGYCHAYLDDLPVYYDSGHLSLLGSEEIGKHAIENSKVPLALRNLLGHSGASM